MITAYKGETQYENEDLLQKDISEIVKSDNLGLLLGAGASKSAGGWIMSDVWNYFKSEFKGSYEFLVDEGIISSNDEITRLIGEPTEIVGNLIEFLTVEIEQVGKHPQNKIECMTRIRSNLYRAVVSAVYLEDELWNSDVNFKLNSEKLQHHIKIMKHIKNNRSGEQPRPWIFTTNYDLVVEWSAQSCEIPVIDGFYRIQDDEFAPRIFKPEEYVTVSGNEVQINLVKLHGSVSWKRIDNEIVDIPESESHRRVKRIMQGRSIALELLVYPGKSMYERVAESIHDLLLQKFKNFFNKTDPVMCIVGYGFGDQHINRELLSALENKSLKVLIYYPEFTSKTEIDKLPTDLKTIIEQRQPNVTIVGGKAEAYFDRFTNHFTGK